MYPIFATAFTDYLLMFIWSCNVFLMNFSCYFIVKKCKQVQNERVCSYYKNSFLIVKCILKCIFSTKLIGKILPGLYLRPSRIFLSKNHCVWKNSKKMNILTVGKPFIFAFFLMWKRRKKFGKFNGKCGNKYFKILTYTRSKEGYLATYKLRNACYEVSVVTFATPDCC